MTNNLKAMQSEKIKMLITAKTYPALSNRYQEVVCTSGIKNDGSFIRIYPILYRKLDKAEKFKKYQRIEAEVIRDIRDPRPESYKLKSPISLCEQLDTSNQWQKRKIQILSTAKTDFNLESVIKETRNINQYKSLYLFKPTKIINFKVTALNNTELFNRKREILLNQISDNAIKDLVEEIPFKFQYEFIDNQGTSSKLQIIDWEIYQLTRKLMRKYSNDSNKITKSLRQKYFDEFLNQRDVYFFLGSNKYWHIRRSRSPLMIIGIFYPPKL